MKPNNAGGGVNKFKRVADRVKDQIRVGNALSSIARNNKLSRWQAKEAAEEARRAGGGAKTSSSKANSINDNRHVYGEGFVSPNSQSRRSSSAAEGGEEGEGVENKQQQQQQPGAAAANPLSGREVDRALMALSKRMGAEEQALHAKEALARRRERMRLQVSRTD